MTDKWKSPENTSGFNTTYEYHCLVRLPEMATKTKGGIELPTEITERRLFGCQYGVLIDHGKKAFTGDSFAENNPSKGDIVVFVKYAGSAPVKGRDGLYYRTMPDYQIMHKMDNDFEMELTA